MAALFKEINIHIFWTFTKKSGELFRGKKRELPETNFRRFRVIFMCLRLPPNSSVIRCCSSSSLVLLCLHCPSSSLIRSCSSSRCSPRSSESRSLISCRSGHLLLLCLNCPSRSLIRCCSSSGAGLSPLFPLWFCPIGVD